VSINLEALLKETSPDAPCGVDISYDPAYLELERMVQGTPETQFSQSEEPNWTDVVSRCQDLWGRSKNLRVAAFFTLGLLRKDGVPGLRDGLALLRGVLERYWEHVYPKLDPDDNLDPLERLNIIATLSPPPETFQDAFKFKNRLMQAPLCSSRQMGRFGLRDILVASGEMAVPAGTEGAPPQLAQVHAAFDDTAVEELQATHQALVDCVGNLKGIDAALAARVSSGVPKAEALIRTIEQADKHVQEALARRGVGVAGVAAAGAGAAPGRAPGGINSKDDVIKTLDRICEFYERSEPSSPVPLLLKRAKRLVGRTFVDIIKDMTPDAIRQVEVISGTPVDTGSAGAQGQPQA